MSEREEVINIEPNENIVIEVNNTGDTAAIVNQVSIFAVWKRVAIGVSIILLLVVPIVGGAVTSYFLRRGLYEPTDPYNVWPDTDYRGPSARVQDEEVVDQGYSSEPNNHFLIRNGAERYFTVKHSPDPEMYMAVYMVENLFDDEDSYGLHVVSSTDKDNLTPYKDISSARNRFELSIGMKSTEFENDWISFQSGPHTANLAKNLGDKLRNESCPAFFATQAETSNFIASVINNILIMNNNAFYYPTDKKSGGYLISNYQGNNLGIPSLNLLMKLRNETREAEEKKKATGSKPVSTGPYRKIKPKFKKLKIQTLTELSA